VRRPVTWLDVFTSVPLTGNQLAVVHDADGIDDATMLAFARETRLSETTFVQTPTQAAADYRNRIFAASHELRFAGHPSLGTAVAVARARGERSAAYVQQTHAGLQPVEVQVDGDAARASMLQEPASFGPQPDPATVMAAAGLAAADAHPDLPPQVVATGQAHLMVPVRDAAVLGRVEPDRAAMRALLEPLGTMVLYLAAIEPLAQHASARGFFVSPARSPRTRRPAPPPDRCSPTCASAPERRRSRSTRASRWDVRAGSNAPGNRTARACQATSSSWPLATCASESVVARGPAPFSRGSTSTGPSIHTCT
jgi:trans-2,3-dihydro-3-hydroxyanthranilate isomerase